MKYAVNEEGVQAMNTMASAITEATEELQSLTSRIRATADGYEGTLGPHKASLDSALSDIEQSLKQAAEPAENVADKLMDVAEAYEEIIANDKIRGASGK